MEKYQKEKMGVTDTVSNEDTSKAAGLSPDSPLAQLIERADPSIPPHSPSELLMKTKTANEWLHEASLRPDPRPLWLTLWYEGEVSCLFADSNLGKSIYAVEIGNHVAQSEPLIYFDFELSDKQFQLRYTSEEGYLTTFPSNFIRAEFNVNALIYDIPHFEDTVIEAIETTAKKFGATKLIIDNLSFLCNNSDKSDLAGRLMLRLLDMKRRMGLSILVLAHTPKRSLSSPITQNDLAGSKKLFNFFDSVFAIGKSAKDDSLRYIKQLKVRAGKFEYGTENVIVSEIVKESSWLHFRNIGFAKENDHLREEKTSDREELENQVSLLRSQGKSMSQIAAVTSCSKTKIATICKKLGI